MEHAVIKNIKCRDFDDFQSKLEKVLKNCNDFVFRGQYDSDWPINTSFQRFVKNYGVEFYEDIENPFHALLKFYKSLYDRKYKEDNFSIDDYIGHGQHYGLPTIYLDWTKTVNKALFFAFSEEIVSPKLHECVAVFALRIKNIDCLVDNDSMKDFIKKKKGIKMFEELGVYLVEPNPRIHNDRIDSQDGVFLKIDGSGHQKLDLVQIIKNIYHCYNIIRPMIYKFTIPRAEAISVLKELHYKSSINFASIYPDKEGISKQAKFEYLISDMIE